MKTRTPQPQACRRGRAPLLCSAGLNLLLLAAVLGLAKHQPDKSPPVLTRTGGVPEAQPPPPAGQAGSAVVVTNQVPFRWAQLESEDFRAYIANLRAARCPEHIIRDLVFHDLERVYAAKEAALRRPDLFWKPGRVRQTAQEERAKLERQMEMKKRAIMRSLLGVSWSKEAWEFWYESGWADIAEMLVGFLPNEQLLEALTVYHDMDKMRGSARDECELCPLAEERLRQEKAYQRMADDFASIMSPADFDEMALRICLVDGKIEDFSRADFRFRDGAEVRDFARIMNRFKPFFSKEFMRSMEDDEAKEALFQAEVRTFLGADRFAVWERSQKAGYQEMWGFGQQQKLAQAIILKAWQVREAAEAEFNRLIEQTGLPPVERTAAWGEVRQETEMALATLLGRTASTEYLKQHGAWLKASPPTPGGEP